jgi:hypothetical protein
MLQMSESSVYFSRAVAGSAWMEIIRSKSVLRDGIHAVWGLMNLYQVRTDNVFHFVRVVCRCIPLARLNWANVQVRMCRCEVWSRGGSMIGAGRWRRRIPRTWRQRTRVTYDSTVTVEPRVPSWRWRIAWRWYDDVTSTNASTEGDVSTRRSYLEALLQWAEWLYLCDLLIKLVQSTLFDLLVSVCLHWITVASTLTEKYNSRSLRPSSFDTTSYSCCVAGHSAKMSFYFGILYPKFDWLWCHTS